MIPEIKKILYATDLSKNSAYALQYAMKSSNKHSAEIIILHVLEDLNPTARVILSSHTGQDYLLEKFEKRVADVKDRINKRLKVFYDKVRSEEPEFVDAEVSVIICEGYPEEQIPQKADELNCGVIVMGTHGKGFISQTFLGSVAKRVLRRTRKPVLIIPLPKEESELTFHEI